MDWWKDVIEIVSGVATIVAVVVGGWWTWRTFVKNRLHAPKADVSHAVECTRLPDGRLLVRLTLRIENTGTLLLEIRNVTVRLQRVLPLSPSMYARLQAPTGHSEREAQDDDHPKLGGRSLAWPNDAKVVEPGESEEIHVDWIIDGTVEKLQAYSYVKNDARKDRDIGWQRMSLHDVPRDSGARTPAGAREQLLLPATGGDAVTNARDERVKVNKQGGPRPEPKRQQQADEPKEKTKATPSDAADKKGAK